MYNTYKENLKEAKNIFEDEKLVKEIIEKQLTEPGTELYLNLQYFGTPNLEEVFTLDWRGEKNLLMIRYYNQSIEEVQSIVLNRLDFLEKHDTRFSWDTLQEVESDPNNYWGDIEDGKKYVILDEEDDEFIDGAYTKKELFEECNQRLGNVWGDEFEEQDDEKFSNDELDLLMGFISDWDSLVSCMGGIGCYIEEV
nr:MAG TPA: hypothetical protein [Caudoviricetes sp.]